MSRYATNHGSSGSNVALAVVNSHLQQNAAGGGCKANHDLLSTLADRYAKGGILENTLQFLTEGGTEEEKAEIGEFMANGRNQLKKIALDNVKNQRQQEAFRNSLQSLRTQILEQSDQASSQDDGAEAMDLESTLLESMKSEMSKLEEAKNDEEYDTFLTICEKAGIETNARRDDEIELVAAEGTQNNTQDVPRCPVTQQEMKDPVRNVDCGHVYSREGINSLMKNGRCPCPIGGCTNKNVTPDKLEEDGQMQIKINRALRRKEIQQNKMSQQAAELEDSDVDE